ncbi:uncharacterized protein FN964_009415 [Alca torda]
MRSLFRNGQKETMSFSPFYNTTVNSTSACTTGKTTTQADHSFGYEPWVVEVAAAIPSILALVLLVILAVVCVRQWKNYSWNQANQHPNGQEEHEYEHEYESSPPRSPDDFYMSMMQGTRNTYVNEDQDKHCKSDTQTQAKPVRTTKPRAEPPVVESIYENHPRCH